MNLLYFVSVAPSIKIQAKICYKDKRGGGGPMAKNGEKWRKMAMANSSFSFVKFAIFRQFLILEFHF